LENGKPPEIGWHTPDEVLPRIVGRTVTGWHVDSDMLHLELNDGSVLIVMGVVCLLKNTSAH